MIELDNPSGCLLVGKRRRMGFFTRLRLSYYKRAYNDLLSRDPSHPDLVFIAHRIVELGSKT